MSNKTPWGEIGYITYKRTYARPLKNGETEEFHQTIERELIGIEKQLKLALSDKDKAFYRRMRTELLGSVAGRFMWQLGTKTVDQLGLASLQNCAFTTVDHPVRPFTWAMDMLMLGSGVGYSIKKEHVYQLPRIRKKIKIIRQDDASADYIVPDTREGWVKLLGRVLKAHFLSGEGFTFSTQLIRSSGAPIKGFGGTASGPEDLCRGIESIHEILNSQSGKKVRPIHCLDIMNIIGKIVVAGNVRRSAQIAIGDYDDVEFLKAKRWDLGPIPNWRNMSNNSIDCDDPNDLLQEFWDTYEQGEPYGLVNIRLSKLIGRLGETQYPDPNVEGYNPCAEQGLEDKETCCLAETFLPNITSMEQLWEVVKMQYKVCKHSLSLKCHHKDTEEVVHRNMRMGLGMTGIMMATDEQLSWLSDCYVRLRKYDIRYSKKMGWNPSIKLTTVKPSGTLSLLAGMTPGVHPSPAGSYYIRRIRIASESPLVQVCIDKGYSVEFQKNIDGTNDRSTYVVSFPCKLEEWVPTGDSIDVIEQLEKVKFMQENWSDNSVSVTAYYNKEDIPRIKHYLKKNWKDNFKTLSFLLTHGHGFDQAPYETISKEEYNEMAAKVSPITNVTVLETDISEDDIGCIGGMCPVK